MFDIVGDHIAKLNDADLRTLVARLAVAELCAQGKPISAVTAGGHQEAPDGGIDVRVDLDQPLDSPDFVKRPQTGFQVKKPDMPPSEIRREIHHNGILRQSIVDLAKAGGSYIIVSAKGTVADTALENRRKAMREALSGLDSANELHIDFYDRTRLATWVNQYPGVAVWIRSLFDSVSSGWYPVGKWADLKIADGGGYLFDNNACLVDERSHSRKKLTVLDGIECIRELLGAPGQCVRLIGMSGLGKTRLVMALCEAGIGDDPLDPALSIYTDYSSHIVPSAEEMARHLTDTSTRAILIIDNCSPKTHAKLVEICDVAGSEVSLLTVEYDVRGDEPERTEVFRLTPSAEDLLCRWIAQNFPELSRVDCDRIAEFSAGNFRIARALAGTVRRGEPLASLRDNDLFERIFWQRGTNDRSLLRDARILALLYSFNGEDDSADGELTALACLADRTMQELFDSITELQEREILQSRGRWRAVLPQAIANRLASDLLKRVAKSKFDDFCKLLEPRMLKSLSRRLGCLHDSEATKKLVGRWLQPDGPLGDLLTREEPGVEIVRNIAPVAPEATLVRLEAELDRSNSFTTARNKDKKRWQCVKLLKSLAYEPEMFERSVVLLARFVATEVLDNNYNSETDPFAFKELFRLKLSGTKATPRQRRDVVENLVKGEDEGMRRAGLLALRGLLQTNRFSSASNFDFGARSRDYGWQPRTNDDIREWYDEAIKLAIRLAEHSNEVRPILSANLRGLWHFAACYDALEEACDHLSKSDPWIDGWVSLRNLLRLDGKQMPADVRCRLVSTIEKLKPVDLVDRAEIFVLHRNFGGYEIASGEELVNDDPITARERASQEAIGIGRAMAVESSALSSFIPQVIRQNQAPRAFQFGQGLAQGALDADELWKKLLSAFRAELADVRDSTVLGGYLAEARQEKAELTDYWLDDIANDPALVRHLPYLQSCTSLEAQGLERLRSAIETEAFQAQDFSCLACGVIGDAPAEPLGGMLGKLSTLEGGVCVAIDILNMHFHCAKNEGRLPDTTLLSIARELLKQADFSDKAVRDNYNLREVVNLCLANADAVEDARVVCNNLRVAMECVWDASYEFGDIQSALFQVQPMVALDVFLLQQLGNNRHIDLSYFVSSPIESLASNVLCDWAEREPEKRYPLLGRHIPVFSHENRNDASGLSPLFLEVLEKAPDKLAFLGEGCEELCPNVSSGSLADNLQHRKDILEKLASHADSDVRNWHANQAAWLDTEITYERKMEFGYREESFE